MDDSFDCAAGCGNGTVNVFNYLDLPGEGKNRAPEAFKALWKL